MKPKPEPEGTVATRRRKLREWIDTHCNEKQTEFLDLCARNDYNLSQSELSGLLKTKSFGEKKARAIELGSGMPTYHLDRASSAPEPPPGPLLAREPSAHQRWQWPFKQITPEQYALLDLHDKDRFEVMILAVINNRGQPEKLRAPAKTIAAA